VYGEPHTQDRHLTWELLRMLKIVSDAPWLLIGDFNESLWSFEQLSLRRRTERQMLLFWETPEFCNMFNLGFSGVSWTFDNKQAREMNVHVRLDRVVAASVWSDWFPDAKVHHLISGKSDHLSILLDVEQEGGTQHAKIAQYEIVTSHP
jgi:endonuclease/exonuclease/phosphatase family metal-dependent hydrolase